MVGQKIKETSYAMQCCYAWLVDSLGLGPMVVPEEALVHYQYPAQTHIVPFTLPHLNRVIFWQNEAVPFMNLSQLHDDKQVVAHHCAVLLYKSVPDNAVHKVALAISNMPKRIKVYDDQAVMGFEVSNALLAHITISAIEHDDRIVPIVNIAALATPEFSRCFMNALDKVTGKCLTSPNFANVDLSDGAYQ